MMTFSIQSYQNTFWGMIAVLILLVAAAGITGITFASRALATRMEGSSRTLRGFQDGPCKPSASLRKHQKAALLALVLVGVALLSMLVLLGDCRINVINDSEADVLSVTGQVESITPRTLTDGVLPFHTENSYTFGVRLVVNGTEYHALSSGSVSVGNQVTLQYLPRSRCVLYLGDGSFLPYPAITAQESAAAAEEAQATVPPVRDMTFPFEDYWRAVLFEAGLCLVVTVILLRMLIGAVRDLFRRKMAAKNAVQYLFGIVVLSSMLYVGCSSAWNGGWQLLLESPEEAVAVQGTVEAVEPLGSTDGVKFSTEWGTHFGCWFTIDGVRYFGMYEGDLTPGAQVEVAYLPASRYVLHISVSTNDIEGVE